MLYRHGARFELQILPRWIVFNPRNINFSSFSFFFFILQSTLHLLIASLSHWKCFFSLFVILAQNPLDIVTFQLQIASSLQKSIEHNQITTWMPVANINTQHNYINTNYYTMWLNVKPLIFFFCFSLFLFFFSIFVFFFSIWDLFFFQDTHYNNTLIYTEKLYIRS